MRTIISFSGGLDTAYLAYKFLTETDDEITLVYLDTSMLDNNDKHKGVMMFNNNITSGSNKFIAKRTSDWLYKNTRHFVFKTKTISSILPDESLNVLFARYAAKLMNDNLYDRACGGWNWDIFCDEAFEDHYPKHPQVIGTNRAFTQVSKRGEFFWPLVDHMFDYRQGNVHALAHLPKELTEIAVGCEDIHFNEKNQNIEICGKCTKCMWRTFCEKKLSEGWTPNQVQEYRLKKSKEFVPGKWSPMRFWIHEELGLTEGWSGTSEEAKEKIKNNKFWGNDHFRNLKNKGIWEGLLDV